MATDEFDPFALSTGLPDRLDITIDEAWFEFDPQYNDGQTLLLKFNVTADDEEFGEGGKGTLQYACGTGWSAEERGAKAVRDDGAKKGFNQQSAYGMFIAAALECDGAENVLRSEGRGDPRNAAMWAGLSFHLDRKEKDYGGDIGKISRLMPTAFLGEGGTGATGGPSGAQKPAGGPAKASGPVSKGPVKKAAGPVQKAAPKPAADTAFGPGDTTYDTLYQVALAAADHESFMEQAFNEVAGVAGNPDIEAAVMDTGPESMWAKAVAEYEASQ